jgi:hypothetical protein
MRPMSQVVVILGASGRLGHALCPLAARAGFDVVAVARTPLDIEGPGDARWITADLTVAEDRARVAAVVDAWTAGYDHVCVVDSVLDRSGVNAMRRSVQGVTDAVVRLRDRLSAGGRPWALLAASTTAVLAPGPYQTPYGLAKRRQIITYARSGVSGAALLLPQLTPLPCAKTACRPVWSFDQAARRLVAAALTAPTRPGFTIRVPDLADAAPGASPVPLSEVGAAIRTHLRSLVLERDSMQAHRAAARSRLRLAPLLLRRLIDHHLAPVVLVRRFAHRHHMTVIDERTLGSSPIENGAAHAR